MKKFRSSNIPVLIITYLLALGIDYLLALGIDAQYVSALFN